MAFVFDDLVEIYPEQLWLEFSLQDQETAWQQTEKQGYSNQSARWNAFLNQLSLNTFITWLETNSDLDSSPQIWPQIAELPSFWEVVNGTIIGLNETRLLLIPSDKSNLKEFEIPQEWVDIPDWAADYYLAVQLHLEEHWMRVWGYVTYEQIRHDGNYDKQDRTYTLDREDLIEDLNLLSVKQDLFCHKPIKISPLPTLLPTQTEALLAQLSQLTPYSPRLDVPFEQWAALLADGENRQQLYRQRLGITRQDSTVNLGDWLLNIFQASWQSLEALLNSDSGNLTFSFRQAKTAAREREVSVEGVKLIDLGLALGNRTVALLVGLIPEGEEKVGIRVQVHPTYRETYLPPHLKLSLLSQTGATLQEIQSRAQDNYIQLKRFKCPVGKSFSIQVSFNDVSIRENFAIETLVEDSHE